MGVRRATLVRDAGGLYLELDDGEVSAAIGLLAFAGIHATPVGARPPVPDGVRAATGRTLAPVAALLTLDVVHIAPLPVGEECARLLGRQSWMWWGVARRRARCKALLQRKDAAYRWERRAWAPVRVLRLREVRRVLRPAVFAPPPCGDAPLIRRAYASDDAISRWAFA